MEEHVKTSEECEGEDSSTKDAENTTNEDQGTNMKYFTDMSGEEPEDILDRELVESVLNLVERIQNIKYLVKFRDQETYKNIVVCTPNLTDDVPLSQFESQLMKKNDSVDNDNGEPRVNEHTSISNITFLGSCEGARVYRCVQGRPTYILIGQHGGNVADVKKVCQHLRKVEEMTTTENSNVAGCNTTEVECSDETNNPAQPTVCAGVLPTTQPKVSAGVFPTTQSNVRAGVLPTTRPNVRAGVLPTIRPKVSAGVFRTTQSNVRAGVLPTILPKVSVFRTTQSNVRAGVLPTTQPKVSAGVFPTTQSNVRAGVLPNTQPNVRAGVPPTTRPNVRAGVPPTTQTNFLMGPVQADLSSDNQNFCTVMYPLNNDSTLLRSRSAGTPVRYIRVESRFLQPLTVSVSEPEHINRLPGVARMSSEPARQQSHLVPPAILPQNADGPHVWAERDIIDNILPLPQQPTARGGEYSFVTSARPQPRVRAPFQPLRSFEPHRVIYSPYTRNRAHPNVTSVRRFQPPMRMTRNVQNPATINAPAQPHTSYPSILCGPPTIFVSVEITDNEVTVTILEDVE